MAKKVTIQILRGTQSELEDIVLKEGELAFTTDTKRLYIGSDTGNILLCQGTSS